MFLNKVTRRQPDPGADPRCVFAASFETHLNSIVGRVIPVETQRFIQMADHCIKIAIPVKIPQSHPMRHADMTESPVAVDRRKPPVSGPSIGEVGGRKTGKPHPLGKDLVIGHGLFRPQPSENGLDVEIAPVAFVSVGHQQIFESIQVDIDKGRTPGPVRGRHATRMRHLQVMTISLIQEKTGLEELGTGNRVFDQMLGGRDIPQLGHPSLMRGRHHIECQKIIPPIAVEISKVYPHGKPTGLPHCRFREQSKDPATLVQPNPIGRVKIIANIEIGKSVLIQIPERRRQPPIKQRRRQRRAILTQESALGELDLLKPKPPPIPVEMIDFAVLAYPPPFINVETVFEIGRLH